MPTAYSRFGVWGRCSLFMFAGLLSVSTMAEQYDYGVGLSLAHDSNITRTPSATPEWTVTGFAGVNYLGRTDELDARILAQVERRNFVDNTFDNDTGYFLNSAVIWSITPQQLSWILEDVATEGLLNLTAPDTPANRTKTNSLSTGPDLAIRVNPTNTPSIGTRYGRYDQGQGADNQRYLGYARWLYRKSNPEKLSLNYEATRVNFTAPSVFANFDREDAYLRYERISPVSNLSFEAGTTRIRPDGGDSKNGHLLRLIAVQALSSQSAMRVVLVDAISDTATDQIRSVTNTTLATIAAPPAESAAAAPLAGSNVATGDVYRSRRGEIGYLAQPGGIAYGLTAYVRSVDYLTDASPDYNEAGGNLAASWLESGSTRIYGYLNYLKRTFTEIGQWQRIRTGTFGVTYRATSTLSISAESSAIASETNVPFQNYVDRRVTLLLGYSTGPLYTARSRR